MNYLIVILAGAGIFVSAQAQRITPQHMDIISIADQFIVSAVAVKKCSIVDDETEQAFRVNFLAVSIRKIQVLKERFPQMSDEQIVERDKQSSTQVEVIADQVIEKYGCQSPEVQQLVQRYKMQAAWKIYE